MKRIKKSYVIIIALLALTVTFFGASYAFFTNKVEGNGKLNIVVGDLTYRLESKDLNKNKITIGASETKEITINLYSLNDIDSKYELYYTLNTTNNNLSVGYSVDTEDNISSTIEANGKKEITVIIRNDGSTETTVEFSTTGGLVNNELVLTKGNSLNQVVGKYEEYSIGDEITLTDGSKWHVLEASDESTETVVLLSDYNLNSDGTYNTTCGNHIDGTYICSPMAFDTDDTSIYDEEDSNNIGYFIKNTYAPLVLAEFPEATNITLPSGYQIIYVDGKTTLKAYGTLDTEWLLYTRYWTTSRRTTVGENRLWRVYPSEDGTFSSAGAASSTSIGARPTITVPKKYIVDTIDSTEELAIGTSVTAIDGSKWHVLESSSSDSRYVTLLSDYNLNSDGSYNNSCGVNIDGDYVCSPMAFDLDNTKEYDEDDSNNIGYFLKNRYEPLVTGNLIETKNVTLPTAEQIASANRKNFAYEALTLSESWLLTTNYWTRTASTTTDYGIWYITSEFSRIGGRSSYISSEIGARPVITTLKTNLINEPVFSNKVVTKDTVTFDYHTSYSDSELSKVLCFYGDSEDSINKQGTVSSGTCVFSSTATYAKVCEYNNDDLGRCSNPKKLATYFIKNGKMLVEFTTYEATVTQNSGYINVSMPYNSIDKVRGGIYTTTTYDMSNYGSIYIDASWNMSATGLTSNPALNFGLSRNGNWIFRNGTAGVAYIHSSTSGNYESSIIKDRATYFKELDLSEFNDSLIILARNLAYVDYNVNVYNAWFQLKK